MHARDTETEGKSSSILHLPRLTSFIDFLSIENTRQNMKDLPAIRLSKAPQHVKVNEKIFVFTDTEFIGKFNLDLFIGLQSRS